MKDIVTHVYDAEFLAKCSCGCGEEAQQVYNGVFIPDKNPMIHYRRWKAVERMKDNMRNKMNLGSMANGM